MLSITIPALDEEAGIADICQRVLAIRPRLVAAGVGEIELIVVDDGSRDRTASVAQAIDGVRVVRHPENRGYGAAIKTGFRASRGELLAFLDADGTYPPEAFTEMASAMEQHAADLVVGSRMADPNNGMPRMRRIGNRFFVALVNLMGRGSITDSASGQRIVRRSVLERLYPLPDGLNFTPVMTTRALHERIKMIEVPIHYEERVGRSKLSIVHDGRRFLTTILWTVLAYNPARVLGMVGLAALAMAGLLGGSLVAVRAAGVTALGRGGIAAAFGTLVLGVAGISILNLGITSNYLVSLFHRQPVRQGLLGDKPVLPALDRTFGWMGIGSITVGLIVGMVTLASGFDIARTWLWLLGSALLVLVGMQLAISWVLMRVLEELSVRDVRTDDDLLGPIAERDEVTGVDQDAVRAALIGSNNAVTRIAGGA